MPGLARSKDPKTGDQVKVGELVLMLLKQAEPEDTILLDTPYFCGELDSAITGGGEVVLTSEKNLQ